MKLVATSVERLRFDFFFILTREQKTLKLSSKSHSAIAMSQRFIKHNVHFINFPKNSQLNQSDCMYAFDTHYCMYKQILNYCLENVPLLVNLCSLAHQCTKPINKPHR